MQFVVVGRDYTDEGALERRLAVRADHIAHCDRLFASGKQLYGIALLNDSGTMCGSTMVFDVDAREELDELLANEPYITGKVWESVSVEQCRVGPTFTRTQQP